MFGKTRCDKIINENIREREISGSTYSRKKIVEIGLCCFSM